MAWHLPEGLESVATSWLLPSRRAPPTCLPFSRGCGNRLVTALFIRWPGLRQKAWKFGLAYARRPEKFGLACARRPRSSGKPQPERSSGRPQPERNSGRPQPRNSTLITCKFKSLQIDAPTHMLTLFAHSRLEDSTNNASHIHIGTFAELKAAITCQNVFKHRFAGSQAMVGHDPK